MKKINFLQLIKLMRPNQWTKNFFVFAAIIFSGNLFKIDILVANLYAFIIFCFVSSVVYVFNDIVDIKKDKMHPQKKYRPLASGKVTKSQAIILEFIIIILVFLIGYKLNNKILYICLFYLLLNIAYSFILKNIIILDVMTITLGFVLRVESGSVATNVELSPWLLLCTILLSLFLALNKRKSEIVMLKFNSFKHRAILEEYSLNLIDNMLSIITPSIFICYCLYTFNSIQNRSMMYTIPFVLYGVFRYQYLMEKCNIGSKPEDVFIKDIPFLINILLWIVAIIIIIYFGF